MFFNKRNWLMFFPLLVTGCVVFPGSDLKVNEKEISTEYGSEADINSLAVVVPINLTLIKQQNQNITIQNHTLPSSVAGGAYRLGSGDILDIQVWNHPELSSNNPLSNSNNSFANANPNSRQVNTGIWVDDAGYITFPLVGKVHVKDRTLPEVQSLLTQKLSLYLKRPELNINVLNFRSQTVSINGAVNQSGQLPITNIPMTIVDAVSLSGGFTEQADTNNIKWTHQGRDYTVSLQDILRKGNISQNYLLSAGDMLYIPPREDTKVYVMGEVVRQSVVEIGNMGLNLTEALNKASGINQNLADATGVFVIRNEPLKNQQKPLHVYQLNLEDATAYGLGTQFKLIPEDVVYVTAAPVSRWNRVLSQILPSVNSASMVSNVAN